MGEYLTPDITTRTTGADTVKVSMVGDVDLTDLRDPLRMINLKIEWWDGSVWKSAIDGNYDGSATNVANKQPYVAIWLPLRVARSRRFRGSLTCRSAANVGAVFEVL